MYFTKFLSVEGKIKIGDKVKHNGAIVTVLEIGGEDNNSYKTDGVPIWGMNVQKVKLFLCSNDIQIGDEYRTYLNFIGSEDYADRICFNRKDCFLYCDESTTDPINLSIKIIGEISPNAIWVKEGDEFKENEDFGIEDNDRKNYNELYILIKCPCCGDFK